MTRDEYRENLIRMWNSLRTDEYKERADCKGVKCIHCPFNNKVCNVCTGGGLLLHAYEATEIVKRWTDEHPIVTNFMKFEEVFGFKPYTKNCINGDEKVSCTNCQCFYDDECAAHNRFWNAEYEEKANEGEK